MMKLIYTPKVGNSPAWRLVVEGHHVLLEDDLEGDDRGGLPTHPDCEAIFACVDDEEVVGVLAWALDPVRNTAKVSLAYVEPSSRRLSVAREMFDALRDHLAPTGIDRIMVCLAYGNKEGRAALEVFGAKPRCIHYEIETPAKPISREIKKAVPA